MKPGPKFSTTTSAQATSFLAISTPLGSDRLMVTLFLDVLVWAKKAEPLKSLGLPAKGGDMRPRSRRRRDSILMTVAPLSARSFVERGPAPTQEKSAIFKPANALTAHPPKSAFNADLIVDNIGSASELCQTL